MSTLVISNGAVRDIVSVKGNVTGQRYVMGGQLTPTELRESLKAKGLKGNKLSNAVREVMRGNQSVAWANTQVFLEGVRKGEMTPSVGEVRKNTAVLRFTTTKEIASKAKKAEGLDPEVVIANKMGIKVEELRQMFLTK
jgi:hypothetical protein